MIAFWVVLCFPLLLTAGYGLAFHLSGRDVRFVAGRPGFVLYLSLLSVPLVAVLFTRPELPWTVSLIWLPAGAASGLVLWWLQCNLPGRTPDASSVVWTGPPGWMGYLLLLVPVAYIVVAEEIVWRGFLLPRVGLVLSSLAFALHHYIFGLRHLVFSFLAGLGFGGLYLTGSLWPPIASHLVYNALAWRHLRRPQP